MEVDMINSILYSIPILYSKYLKLKMKIIYNEIIWTKGLLGYFEPRNFLKEEFFH